MPTKKLIPELKHLKPRPRDWHKGLSGHALIIGGGVGYSGAPRMAAEAALRVGAGLVTIATHAQHAVLINLTRPEIMAHSVKSSPDLLPFVEKANAIALGPGLTQSVWAEQLFSITAFIDKPLIVDADGLNLLAKNPCKKANWILTPHPGEAARLLQCTAKDIQAQREQAAKEIQKIYGGICILKGSGTLICHNQTTIKICDAGNPGMATAGMGDVLTGVIAGLLAQSIPNPAAADLSVWLHATAGDLAAKDHGERGMLATDLMPYLQRLVNP